MTTKQRREHKAMIQRRKSTILKSIDRYGKRNGAYWAGGLPQNGRFTKGS